MSEYTKEDIDSAYDDYLAYKQLADEAKKKFESMCESFYEDGDVTLPSGRRIMRKTKTTEKVDALMLSTLHTDVWNKVINSGSIIVPAKSLGDYGDEVRDCIESKTTAYYTLSKY